MIKSPVIILKKKKKKKKKEDYVYNIGYQSSLKTEKSIDKYSFLNQKELFVFLNQAA